MSAQRWYDDPMLEAAWAATADDYLTMLAAKNDRLRAVRLGLATPEREALVTINEAAAEAWLESYRQSEAPTYAQVCYDCRECFDAFTSAEDRCPRCAAAMLQDNPDALVDIDHGAVAGWLDSASRDFDVDPEGEQVCADCPATCPHTTEETTR